MRHFGTAIAVATCLTTASCTTDLQSHKPSPTGITQGASYHLPELHYDIEVKRTLTQCPILPDRHNPQAVGQIEFQTRATATPRTVAGQEVVIDFEALSAFTKITNFDLERYPSGILKSVNATVDDRTADVAKEAFKAIVSVGKLAIGLPSLEATETGVRQRNYFLACSVKASESVAAVPVLRKAAKEREAELEKATDALDGFNTDHPPSPHNGSQAAQAAKLARAQLLAKEALTAANEALAKTLNDITVVYRSTYVPGQTSAAPSVLASRHSARFNTCREKPATAESTVPEINGVYSGLADATAGTTPPQSIVQLRSYSSDGKRSARWLVHTLGPDMTLDCDGSITAQARWSDASGKPTNVDAEQASSAAKAIWKNTLALDEIQLVTRRLQGTAVLITANTLSSERKDLTLGASRTCTGEGDQRCGILYRTQLPGRLRICRFMSEQEGIANPQQCHAMSNTDPAVLFTDERSIPQMGHLASLGLHNGPFTNNELTASFSEDGSLIKMGYKKPRAEAVAVGETVNSGIDALTAIKLFSNTRELRDLANEKALTDAQVALLNSQKALVQPTEVTALENQASVVKARSALIDAQIQLHKKQAELEALNE